MTFILHFLFMLCATTTDFDSLIETNDTQMTQEDSGILAEREMILDETDQDEINREMIPNEIDQGETDSNLDTTDKEIGKKIGISLGTIAGVALLGTGIYVAVMFWKNSKKDDSKKETSKKRHRRTRRKAK